MKDNDIRDAWLGPPQCQHCGIRDIVLFGDLDQEHFQLIHQPVEEITFAAGEVLYQPTTPPAHVFTIRDGSVKLSNYLADGSQRIVRLLRQGDLAGMETLLGHDYQHTAVALAPVLVCRIPVPVVERLSQEVPRIHRQLMTRWQRALAEADQWLTDLSTGSARQRVARLLLRLAESGSDEGFFLPGREDLGAMLAITTETASRTVADFRRSGLVKKGEGPRFSADLAALETIARG